MHIALRSIETDINIWRVGIQLNTGANEFSEAPPTWLGCFGMGGGGGGSVAAWSTAGLVVLWWRPQYKQKEVMRFVQCWS